MKKHISIKNLIYLLFFIGYTQFGFSQKGLTKEIGVLNENDLYISAYKDRYYTNGTFIYFRQLSNKATTLEKKIIEFQIGQKIYTPNSASTPDPLQQDRPYAGYSYVSYSALHFHKKNYAYKTYLDIGILGPNSKAQQLQGFIHDIYGFERPEGWDYQIKNALGLNANIEFIKPFSNKQSNVLDFTSVTSLKVGTVFTEITTSIYARLNLFTSPLNLFSNSILFQSNLNSDRKNQKNELFIYIKPQIGYATYNATIQGSIFTKNNPVTYALKPFLYEFEIGIKCSIKNFDFEYYINKYQKKNKEMLVNFNTYGAIKLAYKF